MRAQYTCLLMQRAMANCLDGFTLGRCVGRCRRR
jgi:hypothetical protein